MEGLEAEVMLHCTPFACSHAIIVAYSWRTCRILQEKRLQSFDNSKWEDVGDVLYFEGQSDEKS